MNVVRSSQIPWADALTRGNYANRRKQLGGEKITCGLWELAPGKKSFPLHAHNVTEEAMFVISGKAKVRTPEGLTEIGPGDFVSFPAIGANFVGADIVDFPETGKVACSVGPVPTGRRMVFKEQTDYFTGDPDAEG